MTSSGKTRVVSFRLSEAEYNYLQQISTAQGKRSLSEITRLILCELIADEKSEMPETLAKRITQLDRTVLALFQEIRRLTMMIEATLPAAGQLREVDGGDPRFRDCFPGKQPD